MTIYILRRILKYLAPFISFYEISKVKRYSRKEPDYAPVFILGVPRSGTTLFYQLLTNNFDVAYIDNLVNLARPNFFTGMNLSYSIYSNKPHNSFRSNYGNTQNEGLHAPCEAGQIWYKWLPKGDLVLDKNDVSDKYKSEMRNTFNAVLNKYQKPLIIKNLYFALRIKLLSVIFPDAKYLVVRRDPLYIAQSIYLSRKNNNKNIEDWWSVKPPHIAKIDKLTVFDQIAAQVFYLTKQIDNDLQIVDNHNIREVQYENIHNIGTSEIAQLQNFTGAILRKEQINYFGKIHTGNQKKVDDHVLEKLNNSLKKYTFDDEVYEKII